MTTNNPTPAPASVPDETEVYGLVVSNGDGRIGIERGLVHLGWKTYADLDLTGEWLKPSEADALADALKQHARAAKERSGE